MPISPTGNRARGVTLMELVVVLAIVSLILAIAFPSTLAGLENVRLAAGARSVAAFMAVAANRAERRQQAVELLVFVKGNALMERAPEASFVRRMVLPQGIRVEAVWPPPDEPGDAPRRFLFLPGGVPPRVGIELANQRGGRRIVRLDPVTGAARISQPEAP